MLFAVYQVWYDLIVLLLLFSMETDHTTNPYIHSEYFDTVTMWSAYKFGLGQGDVLLSIQDTTPIVSNTS